VPKLLARISCCTKQELGNISTGGRAFKHATIAKICAQRWPAGVCITVVKVLKDIDMTEQQLNLLVTKVTRNPRDCARSVLANAPPQSIPSQVLKQMRSTDARDLPALIYNLLVLSTKGQRRLVLRGLVSHFDHLDRLVQQGGGATSWTEQALRQVGWRAGRRTDGPCWRCPLLFARSCFGVNHRPSRD
jgi:hypothetical protein